MVLSSALFFLEYVFASPSQRAPLICCNSRFLAVFSPLKFNFFFLFVNFMVLLVQFIS